MTVRTYLTSLGLVNALGCGKAQVAAGLFAGRTDGLTHEPAWLPSGSARVGRVRSPLPSAPPEDDTHNHRLLLGALDELRDDLECALSRFGRHRIGVVLGTSTSGMASGETAVSHHMAHGAFPESYRYQHQEIGRSAPFLASYLDLRGPALTLSTACTSSGRALVTACNLLESGVCDCVLAGGADSLSRLTLRGFTALEACTPEPCNPMSLNRKGINLGEGAVLFLMERREAPVALLGVGESSDAYHISAPDPEGRGVLAAMTQALGRLDLHRHPVYVNLHATATPKNDAVEAKAVAACFPQGVPCSGTKPLTGHTLGAAAATEAALCWLTLHPTWNPHRLLPPHRWDGVQDPDLPVLDLLPQGRPLGEIRHALSNAMAFGGNNLALLLGVLD